RQQLTACTLVAQRGGAAADLKLPPKKWIGSTSPEFIAHRRVALQAYMQSVVAVPGIMSFDVDGGCAELSSFMEWGSRAALNTLTTVATAPVPSASVAAAGSGVASSSQAYITSKRNALRSGGVTTTSARSISVTAVVAPMYAPPTTPATSGVSSGGVSPTAVAPARAPVASAPAATVRPAAPAPAPVPAPAPAPAPVPASRPAAPAPAPAPAPASKPAPAPVPAPAAGSGSGAGALPAVPAGRGALNNSIRAGMKLKKAVTVDKSAPALAKRK
ncbi:hypothetical protein EON62_04650, partial [archaeon]